MDDIVASAPQQVSLPGNIPDERGDQMSRFARVWNGALHEFRNHLTVLLASAAELRATVPPALAVDLAAAVTEAERNVQSLTALLAQVDAAVNSGDALISDIGDVIDRALRIAGPSLGRAVSISVSKGRKAGINNRGTALECLLTALIVDLARSAEIRPGGETRRPQMSVRVDVERSSLIVEIQSNGGRPPSSSWRLALAVELAARLDATLAPLPDVAGYLIQFR
jgi:hypothetical protein